MVERDLEWAPGWPGIAARWTSSAKAGVGTALSAASPVWFTLSHGILNEIYFPRVDQACTRDCGFIVTDGVAFFSEEKRDAISEITQLEPGIPAYAVRSRCRAQHYEIEKHVCSDPARPTLLQRIRFSPREGAIGGYHLYVLLSPHLGNRGAGNTAWVGDYKGEPMLFAERDGVALALACSVPWVARSVGFVGSSDGWQELRANRRLTRTFRRAVNGNVAMVGEIDISHSGRFDLALGFARGPAEAAQHARASLLNGFEEAHSAYVAGWRHWHESRHDGRMAHGQLSRISAAVLRTHEPKSREGGVIASLSIPWGASKGDDDLGGYHLVWPRDLVEAAGGFLAVGAHADARRVLSYLQVTQEADGHWSQNMWLDGTPYWQGIQMDETALPILLLDAAFREGVLTANQRDRFWPMVQCAASFLVRNGPVSPQDRWEEDPGYSPFTLAAEIAALLAAAEFADAVGCAPAAGHLRETADIWNASIERWLYVRGTELAHRCGVEGYYVRVASPDRADAASPRGGFVPIKARPADGGEGGKDLTVSPDALALVRFGLRAPDDPRIVNTVKVIDALLKVETPNGPAWRRYVGDVYGEYADGKPFDGSGRGRAWPLLTGERAHYELAAGRTDAAIELAHAVEAFASKSGLLPEQVWDSADIPDRELFRGEGSGSARPLVWAHAEYLKLMRSLADKRVFDLPPQTSARYLAGPTISPSIAVWRFNNKVRSMSSGMTLRIETLARARVHWSTDGWGHTHDTETRDTTLGVHVVDLPTNDVPAGGGVAFTFFWPDAGRWEDADCFVAVE